MACVFLEHITWFLCGVDAVEEFAHARITNDSKWGFESDIFFTVSHDLRTATLKPEVKKWVQGLRDHPGCCEYLHSMLHLIETRMLESNPDARIAASNLYERLKKLESYFDSERSSSFYMKHWTDSKWHGTTPQRALRDSLILTALLTAKANRTARQRI